MKEREREGFRREGEMGLPETISSQFSEAFGDASVLVSICSLFLD